MGRATRELMVGTGGDGGRGAGLAVAGLVAGLEVPAVDVGVGRGA